MFKKNANLKIIGDRFLFSRRSLRKTKKLSKDNYGSTSYYRFLTILKRFQNKLYFHLVNWITQMQRLFIAIIFIFLFTSCDFLSSKKISVKNESMAIDSIIDYSTVDVYPMFKNCENLDAKEKQEHCFGTELVEQMKQLIELKNIKGPAIIYDTIYVDLFIAKDNKIDISGIKSPELLREKIPNLDSVLTASVNRLPTLLQPAIKRGIPVNSQYKLPILIRVKD